MHDKGAMVHRVPFFVPLLNPLMAGLVRLNVPTGADMRLLTVRGRSTGRERTTPVAVFEDQGEQYLLGTFGDTEWVRNLRVARDAILARGRRRTRVIATELTAEEAAPVLRNTLQRYLGTAMRPFLQRYYASSADGRVEDFIELARHHPVFRIRPVGE